MKRVIFTLLQSLLFLLLYAVGIVLPIAAVFLPPFLRIPSVVTKWADGTRSFQWDGVLLMLAVFVLILLVEALRKRLRSAAPWTTLALLLATIAGLVLKLGFTTIER